MKRSNGFGLPTYLWAVLASGGLASGSAMIGAATGAEVLQVDLTEWTPPKMSRWVTIPSASS